MLSRRVVHCVVLPVLSLFLLGALTGCPLLFGGGKVGTVVITASPTSGRAPLAVHFRGLAFLTAPYEVASWTWNFGDGTTADGRNASHTYTAAGTYTATLEVAAAAPKFRGELEPPPATLIASQRIEVVSAQRPPVANAGPDQSLFIEANTATPPVVLDGSASYDPDNDPLTYAWTMLSAPAGSAAALSGADTVDPTFIPDRKGAYTIQLIVNDGTSDSAPDTVVITVGNRPPVANAGTDQNVFMPVGTAGPSVALDGSASYDPDGDTITYAWTFVTRPDGSGATLAGADTSAPTFVPDLLGDYVAQLIVNDGLVDSEPDTVVVTVGNRPAVANAGPDQSVLLPFGDQVPVPVTLDGSASYDPDGDAITYAWVFVTQPAGSGVTLTGADTVNPTFMPDLKGVYEIQLIVNDGLANSAPDTVVVTVGNRPPVANAGTDQSVFRGDVVALDGSASYDPDGDPLSYAWWFVATPGGSAAVLTGADTANPTFTPDLAGQYEIGLRVNDGTVDSLPDSVMITVANRPPTAVGVVLPGNEPSADVTRVTDSDELTVNLDTLYGLPRSGMMDKAFWGGVRLMNINPETAEFTSETPITVIIDEGTHLMAFNISQGRGLAVDPTNGEMWAIVQLADAYDWDGPYTALVRINPRTGVAIPVDEPLANPLSEWYTGLAVDTASVLYGVTYNSNDQPQKAVDMFHSLYEIDKVDTSETFIFQYPEPEDDEWTPGEAIAFDTDDGLMYHVTGDLPDFDPPEPFGAGRLLRSLDLGTLALNSIALASEVYTWYEPTAMTYAPGTDQFYVASIGNFEMPTLSRMTLSGDTATEELVGTLRNDMQYPIFMNGLAFRYDKSFPAPLVTLDGSQSSDPENDPLIYAWSFVSVPQGSALTNGDLSDPAGVTTSFTPDVFGTYELELVVNDGLENSGPATVTVNYGNLEPVADAGADQTTPQLEYYTPVQADGSGSYDPDSEDLTFLWTFLSVPTGSTITDTWIDTSSAAPSFNANVASATEPYVLQLTVTDPDGAADVDTVSVTVTPAPPMPK